MSTVVSKYPCKDRLPFIHWNHFTLSDAGELASALIDGSRAGGARGDRQLQANSNWVFVSSVDCKSCDPPITFSLSYFKSVILFPLLILCFWMGIPHFAHDMRKKTNQQCCMFSMHHPPLLSTVQEQWVGKSTLNLYKYFIADSSLRV